MNLTAKVVPFSSVVGSSVTLHDESGKVVCQLALLNTARGDDPAEWRRQQEAFAKEVASRFASPPDAILASPSPSAAAGEDATDEDVMIAQRAYYEDAAHPGTGLVPDPQDNWKAAITAVLRHRRALSTREAQEGERVEPVAYALYSGDGKRLIAGSHTFDRKEAEEWVGPNGRIVSLYKSAPPSSPTDSRVREALLHVETLHSCLESYWCMTKEGSDDRLLAEGAQHAASSIDTILRALIEPEPGKPTGEDGAAPSQSSSGGAISEGVATSWDGPERSGSPSSKPKPSGYECWRKRWGRSPK